jgi:tRNA threonylcarbamoyladenosine biosynthesis protein TsaE
MKKIENMDRLTVETIISHGPDDTLAAGERIARELIVAPAAAAATGVGARIILLAGILGSGKTLFTKGIARGLGVPDWFYVSSPTFTLINEYVGSRLPLFHFDLYRLGSADELDGLGFEEYLQRPGVVVIEWPEKAADRLHELTVTGIELTISGPKERRITIRRPA